MLASMQGTPVGGEAVTPVHLVLAAEVGCTEHHRDLTGEDGHRQFRRRHADFVRPPAPLQVAVPRREAAQDLAEVARRWLRRCRRFGCPMVASTAKDPRVFPLRRTPFFCDQTGLGTLPPAAAIERSSGAQIGGARSQVRGVPTDCATGGGVWS